MAVDSTSIGTKYSTQIPTLQSDADIQAALTLYHYGQATEPGTVIANSIAGHLTALETNKIGKAATALPTVNTNNDLNTKEVPGFYVQTSAAGAAAGSNYPAYNGSKYAGMLFVTSDNGVIYQDYHMTDGATTNEKFWRAKFAGSWTSWAQASQVGHKHNDLYYLRADATGETGLIGQPQIIGAATSITSNNLTNGYVLVSGDGTVGTSGKVAVSDKVTRLELEQLDGISTSSTIQTQLNTITGTLIPAKPTIVNGKNGSGTQLTGTRQFVIARPNTTNSAIPDATVTATEGDIWFW